MVFTEPAPAPASPPVRPVPLEPDTESDPLIVSESIVGEEVALSVTSPLAVTLELSMYAFTEWPAPLPILFSATEAPTAPLPVGPLPLVPAMPTAKPPASALIFEASLALSDTSPAWTLLLSLMYAEIAL